MFVVSTCIFGQICLVSTSFIHRTLPLLRERLPRVRAIICMLRFSVSSRRHSSLIECIILPITGDYALDVRRTPTGIF